MERLGSEMIAMDVDFAIAIARRFEPSNSALERDLHQKIASGDTQSRDALIQNNLRLAIWVAKRYRGKGVEFSELIAEGFLAVIRAANTWNAELSRFSTYATQAIHWACKKAVTKRRGFSPSLICIEDIRHLLKSNRIPVAVDSEDFSHPLISPPFYDETKASIKLINAIVKDLPQRSRLIFRLRFHDGISTYDASNVVGLTHQRISQIERDILTHIREQLNLKGLKKPC